MSCTWKKLWKNFTHIFPHTSWKWLDLRECIYIIESYISEWSESWSAFGLKTKKNTSGSSGKPHHTLRQGTKLGGWRRNCTQASWRAGLPRRWIWRNQPENVHQEVASWEFCVWFIYKKGTTFNPFRHLFHWHKGWKTWIWIYINISIYIKNSLAWNKAILG